MDFDDIDIGIKSMERDENKQLSLFDCLDIKLPPIDIKPSKPSKNRWKSNKKKASKPKVPKQIDINSIKTLEPTKEGLESGLGVVNITGLKDNKNENSVISTVSSKHKQKIDNRNKELLKKREHPYIKRDCLLTNAEKKLYKFLLTRLPDDIYIMSKVRLADIIELDEAITRDSKAFYRIACKHIDFVVLSPDLDLICAVELDDFTHESKESIQRDQFVNSVLRDCGVPLFRIRTRIDLVTAEDTQGIEMCVLEYLAPKCPRCGRPMEPKRSRNKYNYGHRFYGCMGFWETGDNKCTYTIDID